MLFKFSFEPIFADKKLIFNWVMFIILLCRIQSILCLHSSQNTFCLIIHYLPSFFSARCKALALIYALFSPTVTFTQETYL